jgi:hypothetical protein
MVFRDHAKFQIRAQRKTRSERYPVSRTRFLHPCRVVLEKPIFQKSAAEYQFRARQEGDARVRMVRPNALCKISQQRMDGVRCWLKSCYERLAPSGVARGRFCYGFPFPRRSRLFSARYCDRRSFWDTESLPSIRGNPRSQFARKTPLRAAKAAKSYTSPSPITQANQWFAHSSRATA